MTTSDQSGITNNFTQKCFGCGRQVEVRSGIVKRHGCRWRFLSRARWRSYLEGWHSAHRFAVENPDDPMCLADAEDYGTGWAGVMRDGGSLRVTL